MLSICIVTIRSRDSHSTWCSYYFITSLYKYLKQFEYLSNQLRNYYVQSEYNEVSQLLIIIDYC
jgi:hypothetical protein